MSEDYQSGKFEDGFILSEEKFSKSLIVACALLVAGWFFGPGGGDYAQACRSTDAFWLVAEVGIGCLDEYESRAHGLAG